jgi:hypothetical protein
VLTTDLVDLPIEVMGGYTPALAPTVCPPGASPLTQDCDFPEGAVTTRGGLFAIFGPGNGIPTNVTINGLKTYLTPQIQRRLMVWDSIGNLYKESPDGTLTNVLLAQRWQGSNTLMQSTTLFGREYMAFFAYADPLLGLDIPRQYDDLYWDRVSQVGPGAPPNAADEIVSATLAGGVAGIGIPATQAVTAASETGNIVTLTIAGGAITPGDNINVAGVGTGYNGQWVALSTPPGKVTYAVNQAGLGVLGAGGTAQVMRASVAMTTAYPAVVGETITFAGVGVAAWNTTFTIFKVSGPTGFTVTVPLALIATASSGGGTGTTNGNIVAGKHQLSVAFITRQGFITMPAVPPSNWTASGNKRVIVSGIPTGPFNIVARLLIFTPVITPPATTGTFYSLPNGNPQVPSSAMLINDNTTTTITVDFTDTILIAGFNAQYLFTQLELGECAGVNGYNSRLVWCGERNKLNNFINPTFDGGWNVGGGQGGSDVPLGWSSVSSAGAGARVPGDSFYVDWGDSYRVLGDGATTILGTITQPASVDWLGVPIISINTSYSVRIRLLKDLTITQGIATVEIFSPSAGSLGTFTVPVANISATRFTEFIGPLMALQASLPSDILLRYYVAGTPTLNGWIIADNIEVFPTLQPYNFSTARFSHAFNPESYDGTTGAIQIRPNDGQMLHASWTLRNNLYLFKDHYSCYVTDDGVNEPASWPVNEVSLTVGCCGPNAIDGTEEWFVFAERAGLYICWGSDPIKITPEIQQDASKTGKLCWNSINWASSQSIWVRIDKVNKQILVGVPIGNVSLPNYVFMFDYKWLEGAADIAGSPMVTYSAFTGKVLAHGRGRRWMLWNIKAASMTFAERADGTVQPFYGNSVGNGKIYEQLPPQVQSSDDGVAINSFYSTYYSPGHVEEQMLQLGAHQKLLGYLKWRAIGVGILAMSVITTRRTTILRGYILSLTPTGDGERGMEIAGERFSVQVGTNAVGSWFSLEQLCPCLKKHPTMVVRGLNI